MFYTVASILIIVVSLLFGVGYLVYKNIIQMIKNLDNKHECRLQIQLSEINTKFNDMYLSHSTIVGMMDIRIKVLENKIKAITMLETNLKSLETSTERNLEHTETLTIDLNNKFMINRNMLYDIKKEFARTTREYTTHYTNTTNDIKLLKDNYVTQQNDVKLLKDNYVTQEELNEAIHNVANNLTPKGKTMIKCYKCSNTSMCFECDKDFTSHVLANRLILTNDYKPTPMFNLYAHVFCNNKNNETGIMGLIRFNKTYYYTLKGTDKFTNRVREVIINFNHINEDEFFKQKFKGVERVPNNMGTYKAYHYAEYINYSIGEIDVNTKEVTFY